MTDKATTMPSASAPFKMPHTLALMFMLMVVALVMTWVLPAGNFQTEINDAGREVVIAGTYAVIEDQPRMSPLVLFTSIPRALAQAQGIIFFVFLIGGALAVIRDTGAIDALLGRAIVRFGSAPGLLILAGVFMFSFGSATIGMAVEYIPFVLIGVHHVWSYAKRVQADPSQSLVADIPEAQPPAHVEPPPMTGTRLTVLLLTLGALFVLVWGITQRGWYLTELSALFVALTIIIGAVARLNIDRVAIVFTKGASELAGTALLIGLAGIPYTRWFRFMLPLIFKLLGAGAVALVIAVQIGYS